MNQKAFDLDIINYSLKDFFALFDLDDQKLIITAEDLNNAKKKVLKMHPDKSNLSSEYFLFYKKAFDILKEFYINHKKIDQEINEENTTYKESNDLELYPERDQIKQSLNNMKKGDFNKTFNELFEKNRIIENKNVPDNWFSNKTELYESSNGTKNINDDINRIKKIQAQGQLTK